MDKPQIKIAVLIPCFNEAVTIAQVVRSFQASLPEARIIVYDNNSSDDTQHIAQAAGAEVRTEKRQGKGQVIRRMFADIEADIYLLVDGDATYDAAAAPRLIEKMLAEGLDLVVGRRITRENLAYRSGHRFGNWALSSLTGWIFGHSFQDTLSGYRAMSRRFVKSFPAHATGFDTEIELTVHALELRLPAMEIPTHYYARPAGSHSKLHTWRDGWRILKTITRMARNGKPLAFFSLAGSSCLIVALLLAMPVLHTYLETGLVPRFPTAILSASLSLLGSIFFASGLILDTVTLGRREQKYAAYLSHPALPICNKSLVPSPAA